jgi:hypothetical protein
MSTAKSTQKSLFTRIWFMPWKQPHEEPQPDQLILRVPNEVYLIHHQY